MHGAVVEPEALAVLQSGHYCTELNYFLLLRYGLVISSPR